MIKNQPVNARDARATGLIPGSKRSPAVGNGNPLQYSCLENSMYRGAGRATVHGLAKSTSVIKDFLRLVKSLGYRSSYTMIP